MRTLRELYRNPLNREAQAAESGSGFANNSVVAHLKQQAFLTIIALTNHSKESGAQAPLNVASVSYQTPIPRSSTRNGKQTLTIYAVCQRCKKRYERSGTDYFAHIVIGDLKTHPGRFTSPSFCTWVASSAGLSVPAPPPVAPGDSLATYGILVIDHCSVSNMIEVHNWLSGAVLCILARQPQREGGTPAWHTLTVDFNLAMMTLHNFLGNS